MNWLQKLLPKNKTAEILDEIKSRGAIIPVEMNTSKGVIHIYVKEVDLENFQSLQLQEVTDESSNGYNKGRSKDSN